MKEDHCITLEYARVRTPNTIRVVWLVVGLVCALAAAVEFVRAVDSFNWPDQSSQLRAESWASLHEELIALAARWHLTNDWLAAVILGVLYAITGLSALLHRVRHRSPANTGLVLAITGAVGYLALHFWLYQVLVSDSPGWIRAASGTVIMGFECSWSIVIVVLGILRVWPVALLIIAHGMMARLGRGGGWPGQVGCHG